MAILERELGDAGFVEISEAFGDHAVVLFFCTARQRQIETQIVREFEGNAAVFGACAAEKKQLCSRFCMSSPSVSSTRVCAFSVLMPGLHYELEQVSKPEILRKLKQRFGGKAIRDIRFRVG